jgi:hypothetical protein
MAPTDPEFRYRYLGGWQGDLRQGLVRLRKGIDQKNWATVEKAQTQIAKALDYLN